MRGGGAPGGMGEDAEPDEAAKGRTPGSGEGRRGTVALGAARRASYASSDTFQAQLPRPKPANKQDGMAAARLSVARRKSIEVNLGVPGLMGGRRQSTLLVAKAGTSQLAGSATLTARRRSLVGGGPRGGGPESREGAAARRMSLGFGGAEGREEEGPAEEFVAWTAQKVQAWFRGRREAQAFDVKRRAAISIQRAWRRKIGGLTQRPSLEAAAGVIQRSYRRHRDRAVYQYYRDLIRLRENADTAQMLCSINPTEGQLAESATGLHVRFRLGGESFPPHIMYKIYTHRPVTDIGSFCPRNYVQERAVTTKELHNKAPAGGVDVLVLEGGEATTTGGGGRGGWYERTENNDWRPIIASVLETGVQSQMDRYIQSKKVRFHHAPQVRREERERKKRDTQRKWMVALYSGQLTGKSMEGPGPWAGVDGAGEEGEEEDEEEEDEDLLKWSRALDFDEYQATWKGLACSTTLDLADMVVPEYQSAQVEVTT